MNELLPSPARATASMGAVIAAARAAGQVVVQPRMGFAEASRMRAGLSAVQAAGARTVGTITLDSYTRVGDHDSARRALRSGADLNGFPIVAHGAALTRELVQSVAGPGFAVQVRHGSSRPLDIIEALLDAGLDATEGGPVSYCLPYSRTPLRESTQAWARGCELLAARSPQAHLESFGGCLLGQLCPPGLLVALAVLEGLFFRQHGLGSVSLSYAQQTDFGQDVAAIAALRRLAGELLSDVDWHGVLYTYMGVFPRSEHGALALLRHSAILAAYTGTERLIVKTPAEAYRIPTVEDNVRALEQAANAAASVPWAHRRSADAAAEDDLDVYTEARTLIEAVLELHTDVGRALVLAFERGYLDIPYCLHSDNRQQARSYIDEHGRLRWLAAGRMPIKTTPPAGSSRLRADDLLRMLSHVQRSFDTQAVDGDTTPGPGISLDTVSASCGTPAPGRAGRAGTASHAWLSVRPRPALTSLTSRPSTDLKESP